VADYVNAPVRSNLHAYAYSSNWWTLEVLDEDEDPIDLTGTMQTALVKRDLRDADDDAAGSLTITVTDAEAGELLLHLPQDTVAPGDYYYSVTIGFPAEHILWPGAEATVAEGGLRVTGEATREGTD